ncbi:MAG: hypothetical protein JNK73_08995 [Bacteroidia bacterium]|nr:hypothetical protein [Bacteroidia bacterium]
MKFEGMGSEELQQAEKRGVLSKVLKVLGIVSIVLLIFIITLISLLFIYEDEVKGIVIKELNKNLQAEVIVDPENIDLTILKTFPYCSVEFKNMLMLEALKVKKRDTLLYTDRLNLYFNIRNLWEGKYTIEKISLKKGVLNVKFLKDGTPNYYFWKSDSTAADKSGDDLSFHLQSIEAEKLRFNYKDLSSEIKCDMLFHHLQLSGDFYANAYDLKLKSKTTVHAYTQSGKSYLKEKNCDLLMTLEVNKDRYVFKTADISINSLKLDLKGELDYSDQLNSAKITFSAPKLDISSLLSLLPNEFKGKIRDYKSDGNFYIKGKYSYDRTSKYRLSADFGIENGDVEYQPSSTKVQGLFVKGNLLLSPDQSELDVEKMRFQLGGDALAAEFYVKNFEHPEISLNADADLHLENLIRFYPIDTISRLSGELKLNLVFTGLWDHFKQNAFGKEVQLRSRAEVKNLELQFKGDEKTSKLPACTLMVLDGQAELINCQLIRGSSDLLISGQVPGLFDYLNDKTKPLIIYGDVSSENLQLEDLLMKYYSSEEKNAPLIPSNVLFRLDARIQNFAYAKFKAQNISGNFEIKNQKAIASDVKLKVMEGEAEINAYFDNSKNKLDLVLQSHFKHINISELFKQFNNFGQSTLMDSHLKGYATAQVDLSGTWSNALEADYNSIRSNCDITIEKGELKDFQPMMSLSKFVEVKDLQHIRFSTLQSQVQIKEQKIVFPKTLIRSNALNLEFWGFHTFNNEIEYHFQLLLSELLAKKRKTKDDEFGVVENDPENRRSAYILMTGTVDNPIIKFDKKGLKEKLKNDLKEEKQELRNLLKEEFGLFRKDSVQVKKKQEETKFELEKPGKPPAKKPLEPKKKEEDEEDF